MATCDSFEFQEVNIGNETALLFTGMLVGCSDQKDDQTEDTETETPAENEKKNKKMNIETTKRLINMFSLFSYIHFLKSRLFLF
ncbi:hypothetical protein AAHH67_27990 [Niallia circulans]